LDGWPFGLAQISPGGCARLRVEVYDHGSLALALGGNGKVYRYGRFAGSALLANDDNGLHISCYIASNFTK
jgi:hypothetical protein